MESPVSTPNAASTEEPPSSGNRENQPPAPPPKKTRKRTKTGCLTCRRRRIKCDEGKPTCNNCIKSKRDCEGYSKRLTFKDPMSTFPSAHLYCHPAYHRQTREALLNTQILAVQAAAASSQGPLALIAPKPPPVDLSGAGPRHFGQGFSAPASPSTGGEAVFNPPHQLPTPPFLGPDFTAFPDHLRAAGPGHVSGASAFGQSLQHPQTLDFVAPVLTGQHVPASGFGHSLGQPDGGQGRLDGTELVEESYWQSDDEASIGESDDDDELPDADILHLESNDLGIQVARRLEQHHDVYGVRIRSFAGLAAENILDTYTPSAASSPLNDSRTAAVFWYFVNATGQSISLYERHPFDPTPMFQGHPVPKRRQHIWTYTFPIMAFNHPALMQAILALASLQMAKLEQTPPTAAMKHYHLSLRRIAKNYQSPNRRTQPATLAAALLLGFYEVWNSDHDKWCKHIWGARAILRDIPLGKMTRDVLAHTQRQRAEARRSHQCDEGCFAAHGDVGRDPRAVDTELIFQLTGQKVNYGGGCGRVVGDSEPRRSRLTERDIETYEQLRDLYWWYCKMDVYQSFLGGTRLLMKYQYWTQCVPRAPFGKIDSIYGTHDYLILLLGRLANFASRDLARKRRARRAQAPGQGRGQGPGPGSRQDQSPPSFPGLMPTSGRVTAPRGFGPPRETSPVSDSLEDVDFDASTAAAMREWDEIRKAFDVFRERLGPDFAPMGPDFAPVEMTPFGPTLMYRTYSIAGIWMNYYMGLILLHRSHPSMPPVAVIAAGMAAHQTGLWAREIGRIAAGLHEDTTHVAAISTLVGAAFIESSFCLFVAGVQFQDLQQRHWTIRRLRDIARLTGWQSARQIAEGCESGWNKAAELGRGPRYHSPPELGPLFPASDSVWSRPRRLDRRIRQLEAGEDRLVLAKSEQTHYALGLLSVEQDLETLLIDVEEEEEEGEGMN